MSAPDSYQNPQPSPGEPVPGPRRSRALLVGGGIGVVIVAVVAAAVVIPRLTDSDSESVDAPATATVDQDRDAQDIEALTTRYLSILGSNGGPEGLAPVRCQAAITRAENAPTPAPFPDGDEMVVAETLTQNFYGPDQATSRVVVGATVDGVPSLEGGDGTILAMDFLRENGTWTVCRVDPQ
ncbi:hypothetical protein O4220_21960 [Rhodococcus ruber]|uniref:Uncharacterized protein n=1 Tax=Rhodococcus ruber TaxID=1830 RepID=A0ABT4MJM0_9NOCA|nr:hypothetical protein [Rhodococcus ruber]MCZ4521187.1 hypothetical protein [Rhodococcus ruber]